MENFSNILVISRMIPYSRKTIKVGISLARKFDAKLLVMHLVSNPVDMMAVNTPGLFPAEQYKNYMNSQQEAKEQLDTVIKQEIRGGKRKPLLKLEDYSRSSLGNYVRGQYPADRQDM